MEANTQPQEIRITDSKTGGMKGKKLARFALLPPAAMQEVAEVYGRGAEKYSDRNWELGYNWTLSLDALKRHLNLFEQGEQRDELGSHHLACVVFHALALITYEKYGLGTDDRTKLGRSTESAPTTAERPQVSTISPASISYPVDGNGSVVDEAFGLKGLAAYTYQGHNPASGVRRGVED